MIYGDFLVYGKHADDIFLLRCAKLRPATVVCVRECAGGQYGMPNGITSYVARAFARNAGLLWFRSAVRACVRPSLSTRLCWATECGMRVRHTKLPGSLSLTLDNYRDWNAVEFHVPPTT